MEQLERENQQLKDGAARAGPAQAGSLVDGELLRLQAENTALQKNVAGASRPSLGMWGSWGLSRVFSPLGEGERLQNEAQPCHEPVYNFGQAISPLSQSFLIYKVLVGMSTMWKIAVELR